MKISAAELTTFLDVLTSIERGASAPSIPGPVGQFLRQYQDGRLRLNLFHAAASHPRAAHGALRGTAIGALEFHALAEPFTSRRGFPVGDVADTIGFSEEMGAVVNLTLWLKTRSADEALHVLRAGSAIRADGDYRWTPLSRLTLGEATITAAHCPTVWENARCLKSVADDLKRPPHALEYVIDYRLGAPSVKYFRTVCAVRRGDEWLALPAHGDFEKLEFTGERDDHDLAAGHGVVMLLLYREPWCKAWTVVGIKPMDMRRAFDHVAIWADFQAELNGEQLRPEIIASIRRSWSFNKLVVPSGSPTDTRRCLSPLAREILSQLRRL